jgi:hypothetical protein
MAKQWLTIDNETNKVVGWQRSPADTIPAPAEGFRVLDCDEARMEEYFNLDKEARLQNRFPVILEADGVLSLEADTRPLFGVAANKLEAIADGVDAITFTFTCLNEDGSTLPYTGSQKFAFNSKLYKLNFVNGVASYSGKFVQSGRWTLGTNEVYRVKEPLTVEAYEA